MADINRFNCTGRLTKDIECRKLQNNLSVANFSIAVNSRLKTTDNPNPEADFLDCVAYRGTAEFLGQRGRKGNQVAIEGHIKTGSYTKDGVKHKTFEVVCDRVQLFFQKSDQTEDPNMYYQPEEEKPKSETIVINADALPFY